MFKITKDHENAIKQTVKMASSKATMQALENVLIKAHEKLEITAGDGTVEITSVLDAEIDQQCEFTVNANKFLSILNSCGFDCLISMKQGSIQIKSGRKRFNLSTLDADMYPDYQSMDGEFTIKGESLNIIGSMQSAVIASAYGDSRVMLNGVYLGDHIVATDGHRLVKIDYNCGCDVIVPTDVIKKIPQIDGDVSVSKNMISFFDQSMMVKTKLVDAKYVDYKRAISTDGIKIEVNAEELLDAVKSALITSTEVSKSVEIVFDNEKSFVESRGNKSDESSIAISASGDIAKFSANGKYIVDALGFYTGQVNVTVNDRQMIIDNGDVTNVVMAVVK